MQNALTFFETLKRTEMPFAVGKHPTSRYSLVKLNPATGRIHQLRKHMAHILHPIIGDRPRGCNKQNRYFKEHFDMTQMMLHAVSLEFVHPVNGKQTIITAGYKPELVRMIDTLRLSDFPSSY